MTIITRFIRKSLAVFRLGKRWFNQLLASLVEAGRTHSYVETVNPSQSDTFHKEIKLSDGRFLRRTFEQEVRKVIKLMRLTNVRVAVDATEEPYWGKNGLYNTRTRVHEKSEESWQYVNLSIVSPKFIPLMSIPYRQLDDLDSITIELLEYLKTLPLRVKLVLFDRGFYHSHLIDYLENRRGGKPLPYLILVPKNPAMKEYIVQTQKIGVFEHQMCYTKHFSKWKPRTKIVICKGVGKTKNGKLIDWCFATNQRASLQLIQIYRKRWNIETGFRIQDEAQIKTKSSNPLIRYFYHLLSMLMVLAWRVNNHVKPYQVFKRFIKIVEKHHENMVTKPPPASAGG